MANPAWTAQDYRIAASMHVWLDEAEPMDALSGLCGSLSEAYKRIEAECAVAHRAARRQREARESAERGLRGWRLAACIGWGALGALVIARWACL